MKKMAAVLVGFAVCLPQLAGEAQAVINNVNAGAGLTGGGSASSVVVHVATGPGLKVVGDKVRLVFAGLSCPEGTYLEGFTAGGGLHCSCLGGLCATQAAATDGSGDVAPGNPDIVSAELAVGNGNLTAKILFAPGTFNKDVHLVTLNIDADQNPSTGISWRGMGIEGTVESRGTCTFPGLEVYTTGVGFTNGGNVRAIPDGLLFSVPMGSLWNDDGKMDVLVSVSTIFTCDTSSAIIDTLPDSGVLQLAP